MLQRQNSSFTTIKRSENVKYLGHKYEMNWKVEILYLEII